MGTSKDGKPTEVDKRIVAHLIGAPIVLLLGPCATAGSMTELQGNARHELWLMFLAGLLLGATWLQWLYVQSLRGRLRRFGSKGLAAEANRASGGAVWLYLPVVLLLSRVMDGSTWMGVIAGVASGMSIGFFRAARVWHRFDEEEQKRTDAGLQPEAPSDHGTPIS